MSSPSTILTRTFSLIPRASGKTRAHKQVMERMVTFRGLENIYIDILVAALQGGRLLVSDFSGESKAHVKGRIYNELKLNEIYSAHPVGTELKERMRRCAIQYPYFAVREWLVRTHYLSLIFQQLIELITHSPHHAAGFLHSNQLLDSAMRCLSRALSKNVFGNHVSLSFFYIQNLIGQARNLFLVTSSLESMLNARVKEILNHTVCIEQCIKTTLCSFTKKRKGKEVKIPISDLLSYFSKRYIVQVKRKSSWHAKNVEKHPNLKKYKKKREQAFAPLEISLKEHVDGIDSKFIKEFAREVVLDVLDEWLRNTGSSLTKKIFKPMRQTPRVGLEPSRAGFIGYFKQVLRNQVRCKLKDLFLTTSIINGMIAELKHLEDSMPVLVSPPRIKRLAVPINQKESVYHPDFKNLTVKISFLSREWLDLDIKDEKGRIKQLLDGGATPNLPVITMKGRKLLLHLPLELNSSDLSDQSSESVVPQEKRIEIGGDLGLKHPAVLSVMDRSDPEHPVEIVRYFLGMRTLFDMTFSPVSGKFEKKARFSNTHSNKKSNLKHKLRNIRREARNLQRKVHEYENRFMERRGVSPRNKYKYYRLQRDLSRAWERVNRMNREVVRQLQHVIIAIATFHDATILKFENLKWSRHSKKHETGGWLSFWQVHWFFSQVQEAVEFQARLKGIAFHRVRAEYTSQDCWECHGRGSRAGRSFMCSNAEHHALGTPIQIHADLNAARVIALS